MRIIYGVAGEGFGHATRAKPIIEHLSKKNEVLVVCGGKAYTYLSRFFKVEKIDALRIAFKNNEVRNLATFFKFIRHLPEVTFRNLKLIKLFRKFNPEVVITDFEPFVTYVSYMRGVPRISLGNQHLQTRTKVSMPGNFYDKIISRAVIRLLVPYANHYIVSSVIFPKVKDKKTHLVIPTLRREILRARITKGSHILVYLSTANTVFLDCLQKLNEKVIIYGMNNKFKRGNIISKKISNKSFINDFASCKFVICNGGFTLLSEAIYLRKPILSIPIKGHYEQYLNAQNIEQMGFGRYAPELTSGVLRAFMKRLPSFKKALAKEGIWKNTAEISKVEEVLNSIKRKS